MDIKGFDILLKMTMYAKPKNLIHLSDANNYSKFKDKIETYSLCQEYLGNKLESWIKYSPNPFAIIWIRQVLFNKLNVVEMVLNAMIKSIGHDNLINTLSELEENVNSLSSTVSMLRRLFSIEGEFQTHLFLVKELKIFEKKKMIKISKVGDWKCGKNIISVKTKLDYDMNHQILEDFILGYWRISEFSNILKRYNSISISKANLLNNNELINIINELGNKLNRGETDLDIFFEINRDGITKGNFSMEFSNTPIYKGVINIQFDTDTWIEDTDDIYYQFEKFIKKYLLEKANSIKNPPDWYQLFIYIVTHPRYHSVIMERQLRMQKSIKTEFQSKFNFPITMILNPRRRLSGEEKIVFNV